MLHNRISRANPTRAIHLLTTGRPSMLSHPRGKEHPASFCRQQWSRGLHAYVSQSSRPLVASSVSVSKLETVSSSSHPSIDQTRIGGSGWHHLHGRLAAMAYLVVGIPRIHNLAQNSFFGAYRVIDSHHSPVSVSPLVVRLLDGPWMEPLR